MTLRASAVVVLVCLGISAMTAIAADVPVNPEQSPAKPPEALKLNPKETAVLLIEFQNEFCKPNGKLYEMVKPEMARQGTIPNGMKLAAETRKAGCVIVHIPFVYDENWYAQTGGKGILGMCKELGWFRAGTWNVELIDEMKPAKSDIVLNGKCSISSFSHTDLDKILKEHKIKNIVCAGFSANLCVETTARAGYDLGYNVVIAKNATGCGAKEAQDYLDTVVAPMFGSAATVDEVVAAMK